MKNLLKHFKTYFFKLKLELESEPEAAKKRTGSATLPVSTVFVYSMTVLNTERATCMLLIHNVLEI